MPYCPSCKAEYQESVSRCTDCDVDVVASLEDTTTTEEMANVYACYNTQQVERVVGILQENGLDVLVRDRSSSAFPTYVGTTAQQLVAVAKHEHDRARDILQAAITDEILPGEGDFL